MRLFLHRLTHWEYWPFELVYIPVFFVWAYYALKSRSLFFFNAANPGIINGGFMMESKKSIYDLIPTQYYPTTTLIPADMPVETVMQIIVKKGIGFPLIAKPDIGLRGSAVKKINSEEELTHYCRKANFDFIIQDLISFPNEVGIFYVRFPEEPFGKITGIVAKEFLVVKGDGQKSVEQLLMENPRHALQLGSLQKEYGSQLLDILPIDMELNLVPYGNHARGAKFIDATKWNNPDLERTIDNICQQINGFYFGRIDIMYNSLDELSKGENFSIVELNGAGSEPTHIYDPSHSIFFAWKELIRHISMMYKISVINHKKGIPYLEHQHGMAEYRRHLQHEKTIVNF